MTILFRPQGAFGWFSYTTSRDTIAGYVRAKESINRAVQTNIREFLSRLETSAH